MAEHDKKNDAAVVNTLMQGPAHPDTEIFADGVFNMWLRSGVLKIDLYQSTGIAADGKGEFRRLAQRVSLPVTALGAAERYAAENGNCNCGSEESGLVKGGLWGVMPHKLCFLLFWTVSLRSQ